MKPLLVKMCKEFAVKISYWNDHARDIWRIILRTKFVDQTLFASSAFLSELNGLLETSCRCDLITSRYVSAPLQM